MSRDAIAAASLPLRNSIFWRTLPAEPPLAAGGALSITTCGGVMVKPLRNQFGEQRHAQFVGEAGGFRGLGQRAGGTGLDTAQAPLAVLVVDALQLALELAAVVGFAPGKAEVRADQVAHAAMNALGRGEH